MAGAADGRKRRHGVNAFWSTREGEERGRLSPVKKLVIRYILLDLLVR